MLLDNQLYIRINDNAHGRMCTTVMDVCQYVYELTKYQPTDIEYKALSDFWNSVLPMRSFAPEEKRRTLILVDAAGNISELAYKEMEGVSKNDAVPAGSRKIGQIFAGAYTNKSMTVARFDFGEAPKQIIIHISRKDSHHSHTLLFAEDLWFQQSSHFSNPLIPKVKADLSKYKGSMDCVNNESYSLCVGDHKYPISCKSDFISVIEVLTDHSISEKMAVFIDVVFSHLHDFPKFRVFSPVQNLYSDASGTIYVGGDGTKVFGKIFYCGKLYPAYFTGEPGALFSLNIGFFEDVLIKILFVRE